MTTRLLLIDCLSTKFVKTNADLLSAPWAILFNRSVNEGTFPEIYKVSIIIPLFKSEDRNLVSNYRPISLLPIFSKILEKIIHKRLTGFLDLVGLFADSQYGFRHKRSTDLALFEHLRCIISGLERRNKVAAIYCDISKAFDTIDHTILLNKMENCGVRGNVHRWFKSYLEGRKQCVRILGSVGESVNVTRGVPQGSALGPLLFIIYINDLLRHNWGGNTFCFADDTALVVCAENENSLIEKPNAGVEGLHSWFRSHKMALNHSNTKLISYNYHIPSDLNERVFLHTCNPGSRSLCDCPSLKQEYKIRYLGLTLDSWLLWHEQSLVLQKRIRSLNYMIYHLSKLFEQKHVLTVYRTLYESVLRFGIVHWGGANESSLKPIRILQKKVVRNMAKVHQFSSSTPWFETFQIPTLSRLYALESACFVNRNLVRINGSNLQVDPTRRGGVKAHVPNWLKQRSRAQSPYAAPKFFNSVLKSLRSILQFKRFRKSLLDTLLRNTGYR